MLKTPRYHGFMTEVGNQIVDIMTGELHLYIAKEWINQNNVHIVNDDLDTELGEKCKKTETEKQKIGKLKLLKNLFIKKVNTLKTNDYRSNLIVYIYGMQRVATEIYNNCKGKKSEKAEKQLAFFMDLFVVNLKFIEEIFPVNLHVSRNWQMQMKMEPISGKN
jgi:hypothetical protein